MTTPTERTRAVIQLGIEVAALGRHTDSSSDPVEVPRETLRVLMAWLRHYPTPSELAMTAERMPELWSDVR